MVSRLPHICVISRIPGLRAALDARGVNTADMEWHAELDSPAAQQSLARCEVLLGEPAVCGPVVDACPKLVWLQSTFAGCNQLLTSSARRDYAATRLAGCFGPCMAEYAALHILALERR